MRAHRNRRYRFRKIASPLRRLERLEPRNLLAADLVATGFTGNGTDFRVDYDITTANATAFDIAVYRSSNGTSLDTLLVTQRVTDTAKLQVGTGHQVTIAAGFTDVQQNYYLVVKLDAAAEIAEGSETNNQLRMTSGIFRTTDGAVHIHGSDSADTVSVALGTTLDVTLNGNVHSYTSSGVPSIRVRSHGGNDTIAVTTGLNKVLWAFGGAGDDSITGGEGNDILYGGDDNDTIHGKGGDDKIWGEGGNDTIHGGLNSTATTFDYLYAGDGNDIIYGDNGDFSGSGGRDSIDAGAGHDTVYGEAGNDVLFGGTGNDTMYGGAGDDSFYAGADSDNLYGETGNDTLRGDAGDDTLEGGVGNDSLEGGYGNDVFIFAGSASLGTDTIIEMGNWAGSDLIDFSELGAGVSFNLGLGGYSTQVVNSLLSLKLSSAIALEQSTGTAHGDTLTGNSLDNILDGGDGDDTLYGGAGNDTIWGGDGIDSLYGGDGDDYLLGDYGGSADYDDFLYGNAGNDSLYGDNGYDGGDDYLEGGTGDDYLEGGAGIDTLVAGGETGDGIADTPEIEGFAGILDQEQWTFSGSVIDDDVVEGLIVYFGGLLEGHWTTVDTNGYFSYSVTLTEEGAVTAWVVDGEDLTSPVVSYSVT